MQQVRIKTSATSSAVVDARWVAYVNGAPYVCGREVELSKRPIVRTGIAADADQRITQNQIANQLQILLDTVHELGFVVTVDTVSLPKLAMGNYVMVGNVRGAR